LWSGWLTPTPLIDSQYFPEQILPAARIGTYRHLADALDVEL